MYRKIAWSGSMAAHRGIEPSNCVLAGIVGYNDSVGIHSAIAAGEMQ
jgi:redox-sensitive bicupin YhaK (pirin superfamily)